MSTQPQESASSSAATPVRIKETSDAPLRAILVIHGVGQQLPFQPIDSFANGLRATLQRDGKKVSLTHFMRRRDEGFDHSVRVEAVDAETKERRARLDIHEFYWAPLTQGKASFTQMLRWLVITGFTPVRRLAFNFPLLFQRAESRAERWGKRLLRTPHSKEPQQPLQPSRWRRVGAAVMGTRKFWLLVEFLREMWRLIYVALAAAVVTALTAAVVNQSTTIVKSLPKTMGPLLESQLTWSGAASIMAALVALIAGLALLLAIPEQLRHLVRLRKVEPVVSREVGEATREGYTHGNTWLTKLYLGGAAGLGALVTAAAAHARWKSEIKDRGWLLPLSILSFATAAAALFWLSLPNPPCVAANLICPTPDVYSIVRLLAHSGLPKLLLLLGLAFFLTRVFVDYLGDVALYTMAAENSTFFQTRVAIQKELSKQLRSLLRDKQYESVAIAGHSLGSVIGYDAISQLRAEVARDDTGDPSPITREEFAKLTTFITFGSPLNKVLYFFRISIKDYESVRSHIVRELLGFRQQESLLMRDPSLRGRTATLEDKLRWVNFYSPMDPISGRLIYFSKVREHRHWYALWGYCHMSYWYDPTMYREIMATLQPERIETEAEAMEAEAA